MIVAVTTYACWVWHFCFAPDILCQTVLFVSNRAFLCRTIIIMGPQSPPAQLSGHCNRIQHRVSLSLKLPALQLYYRDLQKIWTFWYISPNPNMAPLPVYIFIAVCAMTSQITGVSIVYSDADQRKHQSSALLAFIRGIHRWQVNSPHKAPVTLNKFPFDDDVSWEMRFRKIKYWFFFSI